MHAERAGLQLQRMLPFGDRRWNVAAVEVGARQLFMSARLVGILLQLLPQLTNDLLEEAGVEVSDLQIALGDLHARIQLERRLEMRDRLVVEAFVVKNDAKVVVGTSVVWIDALR